MRSSCNGCRVLRKACNDSCAIRPCLLSIKSADSQARATLFLAKFYGRAGLLNLLGAAPDHLRPGVFRSLLYEACGRVVNPVYGSAGLLTSGSWKVCEEAVEAVLSGAPIGEVGAGSRAEEEGSSGVFSAGSSSQVSQAEEVKVEEEEEEEEVGLELSLGWSRQPEPDVSTRVG